MKAFKKRLKAMWFGEDVYEEEVPIETEEVEWANEVGVAIPIGSGTMPNYIFNKRSTYE